MISSFYNKCIHRLDTLLKYKCWYLLVTVFVTIAILFFTSPSYFPFTKDFHVCVGCADFQGKIDRADHFFKPTIYPPASHMSKTQFRFTVALIAKITGIRSTLNMYILQQVLGVIMLGMACLVFYKITANKVTAALLTFALGFIYSGEAAFVDTLGYTDAFAYIFLMLTIFTRNKLLLVISLLLACFTDERAIIGSLFIGLFFLVEYLELADGNFKLNLFVKSRLVSYITGLVVYVVIHTVLHVYYGFYTPSDGLTSLSLAGWEYILWNGLKGFWIIVVGCFIYLAIEKRYLVLSFMILGMLATLGIASLVLDLTRSIAYVFPVIFIATYFFNKGVSQSQIQKTAVIICLVTLLCTNTFYIFGVDPTIYRSIPIKIIQKLVLKRPN